MKYRLAQGDGGSDLESVGSTSDNTNLLSLTKLVPSTTPAPDEEDNCSCAENFLAELHKFMQSGVKIIEGQLQNDDDSVDSDHDDDGGGGSARGDGEQLDLNAFLRQLSERTAKTLLLLEKEGAVPLDASELARELSEQCRAFAEGKVAINQVGFKALLGKSAELLHKVRPVDLDLLLQLLQAGEDAGDTMQDKDVLLLIGQTGCGKTSTIHYLAGSTFKQIIVNGFDHLQIVNVAHPDLRNAETSSSTRSVTRSVQSIDITSESGKTVAICDTPGFNDTDGVEIEIANGFGMVRAIHRAKRVKPVLVLSEKGIGDRFGAVSQDLRTISKLVGASAGGVVDPKPFAYVFTKYDVKYQGRLHEQFRAKHKQLTAAERENVSFSDFVNDIKYKTKPVANIVTPLDEDKRSSLLSVLMEGEWYEDPVATFSFFVSDSSLNTLKVQLQLTCTSIRKALERQDSNLVMTKLLQLVELGNRLPDSAAFSRQGVEDVSDFLRRCKESLSSSIEKCKELRDHGDAFKRELKSAKEAVEILVAFHPISNTWNSFQQSSSVPVGSDFCARSIAALTDFLEERVFSGRDNVDNLITALRQQKQAAIIDLSRLKDVADTFTVLAHIVPRTVQLYQECSDALGNGIIALVHKHFTERESFGFGISRGDAGQFMPTRVLLEVEADFDLFLIFGDLEVHGVVIGGHKRFTKLWDNSIAVFVRNLQKKISAVTEHLSSSDKDLKKITKMDLQATADVRRVLCFLMDHPPFSSLLEQMNADIAAQKLQELEASIGSFVLRMVDKIEAEFSVAKEEDDEAKFQEIAQYLANADKICTFCKSDNQGKRVAVLGKSLDDYLQSLSAKQHTILDQAKHYLRVIETQDPASFLTEIATAWDEWEIAFAKAPKGKSASMVNRFFSAFGLANSNQSPSKESDFCLRLKAVKLKISQGLRRRLENSCQDTTSPSSILFLVSVVAMEKHALIAWILDPPNAKKPNRLVELYTSAQIHVSQFVRSLCVEKSIKARNFVALNIALNEMKVWTATWQQIKKTAHSIDSKNDAQRRLRNELLAFKDYPSQCQYLLSQIQSFKRAFYKITFLDDTKANSINEHDRNAFYREVVSSLPVFEGIQVLRGHLASEIDDNPLDHVEKQIECIYRYLAKLMSAFPNIEADFQKLYIWRSNLRSIEGCFTDEPMIVGIARRSRDDIDRTMALASKSIEPPADSQKVVPLLILLKKASIDIPCWRSDINQAIDELLLSMSKTAPNGGRFILGLELELKNVQGADETVALQILSEHHCFEGAMNAVFNSATARQGIGYVVDSIDLSVESSNAIQTMYGSFQEQYKGLIERGLVASKSDGRMLSFFQKLVNEAKTVAIDYSVDYRSQLTRLTSLVFAYWSLKSMNSFVSNAVSNEDIYDTVTEYLMKPHAAQVVSIWCLLNFEHDQYQALENHLIEILTGEGKSIALGVTAIILAMLECDVACVCYSAYLSSRDYDAFQSMFHDFGVLGAIKYSTAKEACGELYNRGGDTRSLSNKIVWGKKTRRSSENAKKKRLSVLLIDEVDVFFQKDFYGETYNSVTPLYHRSIEKLLKYIWANRDSLDLCTLSMSQIARTCLGLFPEDIQPIISKQISYMLRDAKAVDSHDYIVHDRNICYKEFDGLTRDTLYGYLTTFVGIKEHQNGNITKKAMDDRLCVYLDCGRASYAEIPTVFDAILGVTGTLASLGQNKKDILSHQYGIDKMTYIPSVYGKNKMKFAGDNPKDVIITDDDANFHLELRNEINTRRKPDKEGFPLRAVMAFFESREELEAFYESEQMLDLKSVARVLTEELAPRDKEGAFQQSTRAGTITLMIREYGRGTDFKVFDGSMLDGGGVHVIQAFFSTEIAEEIQIRGRTARQGAKGSYSMVLALKSLTTNMGLVSSDVEQMRLQSKLYSYLDSKRSSACTEMCNQRKCAVKEAERSHYETIDYKQCALHDKRQDAIVYLEKWNGVASVTPSSVATKNSFIVQKLKRVAEIQEIERNKRAEAGSEKAQPPRPSSSVEENMEEEEFFDACDNPVDSPMMNGVEDTHYSVLGVSFNANIREIESAFRRASLACHPDSRNNDPDASDHFYRLAEAKEILSCPARRRDYDVGLLPS